MKKIVMFLFVMMVALSVKAQVYVGGTLSVWHDSDLESTTFIISPEIGYNLNEKWAIGGNIGFAYNKVDDVKSTAFAIAPYARYSYYENKIVRLFLDGGFGISTSKLDDSDSVTGFEVGVKPGIAIKLNDKFSLVAKCGFLGYREDYLTLQNGGGLALTSEDLSFGFHLEF
ncbi:outer membrane beta-barrel protein [uncultured Bacteroides sp.]|uniref:outer membrane beta-barrel protein n=1 Tax=uncultured Bacteroides sp. TaxID=162156 RepID=UPI0025E47122|nr:outer membrane beta-barrel protein [uncultured Bacteroides sp.]